jgi:hypothetical protein
MLGLSGIWGTSESDLFISSDTQQGVYHFDGTTSVLASTGRFMRGVWGAASNDVFAVGSQGAVYRFTGTWSMMSNGSATLNAVSGSSNMHVLAAGNEVIELFDGAMWQETAMTGLTLHSISTSPTGNALAAGRDDTNAVSIILVQEGASWNRFNAVGIDTLYGVWAKSDNDAYSVGDNGYIAHFNGTWTQMSSPTTNQLRAVAGIDNEVFAVGAGGVILRLSPK